MLANPPFHLAGGSRAADPGRDRAQRETDATLEDWIAAALRRLVPGGRLVLVHRTGRLGAILAALADRAGSVEVLPIAPRAGHPATRLLLRARKGRAGPLTLWPPLTFHSGSSHTADGETYTAEVRRLLRDMAELLPDARLSGTQAD